MTTNRFINPYGSITIQGVDHHVSRVTAVDFTVHTRANGRKSAVIGLDVELGPPAQHQNPSVGTVPNAPITKQTVKGESFTTLFCPTRFHPGPNGKTTDCQWVKPITHPDIQIRVAEKAGGNVRRPSAWDASDPDSSIVNSLGVGWVEAELELIEESFISHVKHAHGYTMVARQAVGGEVVFDFQEIAGTRTVRVTEGQWSLLVKVLGKVQPGNSKTRRDIQGILDALAEAEADVVVDKMRRGL